MYTHSSAGPTPTEKKPLPTLIIKPTPTQYSFWTIYQSLGWHFACSDIEHVDS